MRIGELLQVAERADMEVVSAEADIELTGGIARHGRSGNGVIPEAGMGRVRELSGVLMPDWRRKTA
jgi:hypothetical protein